MISMEQLKIMKNDAVLINVSRGAIINTEDLLTALQTGVIGGAGLDVIEGEPLPADHPAHRLPNLIYTPHVSMYSEESMVDLHLKLSAQALDVLAGKWTRNIVNPAVKEVKEWK